MALGHNQCLEAAQCSPRGWAGRMAMHWRELAAKYGPTAAGHSDHAAPTIWLRAMQSGGQVPAGRRASNNRKAATRTGSVTTDSAGLDDSASPSEEDGAVCGVIVPPLTPLAKSGDTAAWGMAEEERVCRSSGGITMRCGGGGGRGRSLGAARPLTATTASPRTAALEPQAPMF